MAGFVSSGNNELKKRLKRAAGLRTLTLSHSEGRYAARDSVSAKIITGGGEWKTFLNKMFVSFFIYLVS